MSNKLLALGIAAAAAAGIVVTGATFATPIVITLGAGHGLKNDDRLAIAGVTGNTGANGVWKLANVTATTAVLLGSTGTSATFGGTVRAAPVFDVTPTMRNHSAALHTFGNLVGTVDIEAYDTLEDFAAGVNTSGIAPPILSPSVATNSAGSSSAPAKSTLTMTAANAGLVAEIKMARIMRLVCTAYTSGSFGASAEA